jgi:hypothetical protein
MLGIRVLVSIGSVIAGTIAALVVLLGINHWLSVEIPGQVAVSMAIFAFARDLAAECLERLLLSISARHVRRLLVAHLLHCEKHIEQPIPWSRLHHAVERLTRIPSRYRWHAQRCLSELESYSDYASYALILGSFDMSGTLSLVRSLTSGERQLS